MEDKLEEVVEVVDNNARNIPHLSEKDVIDILMYTKEPHIVANLVSENERLKEELRLLKQIKNYKIDEHHDLKDLLWEGIAEYDCWEYPSFYNILFEKWEIANMYHDCFKYDDYEYGQNEFYQYFGERWDDGFIADGDMNFGTEGNPLCGICGVAVGEYEEITWRILANGFNYPSPDILCDVCKTKYFYDSDRGGGGYRKNNYKDKPEEI